MAANGNRFARGIVRPANLSFAAAIRAVNPVVQAPRQSIHAQLLVAEAEAGEQNTPLIRAAIAVRIAEIPDVRRGRDQHAAAPRQHAIGKRQMVREHRRHFVAAIAIAIFEKPDAAGRFRVGIINHPR